MAEPATALLPNNKDFVREWEVRNGHLPLSSNGEHEAGNGPAPSIIEFAALQVLQVCGGRKTRLAGLEPTASASAGLRSIQLSYKRSIIEVWCRRRDLNPHTLAGTTS